MSSRSLGWGKQEELLGAEAEADGPLLSAGLKSGGAGFGRDCQAPTRPALRGVPDALN